MTLGADPALKGTLSPPTTTPVQENPGQRHSAVAKANRAASRWRRQELHVATTITPCGATPGSWARLQQRPCLGAPAPAAVRGLLKLLRELDEPVFLNTSTAPSSVRSSARRELSRLLIRRRAREGSAAENVGSWPCQARRGSQPRCGHQSRWRHCAEEPSRLLPATGAAATARL